MKNPLTCSVATDSPDDVRQLERTAAENNWGLWLIAVGWLHLLAFSACYYLTIVQNYHDSAGYLFLWIGEFAGMCALYWLCCGRRSSKATPCALQRFVVRVWICYFILAFNLGSLNTLRGHALFEFFPAMASLASFGFMMMTIVVSWRFFIAVLVMFTSGLFMAAHLHHAYLIFGLAWWLVLNGIGLDLWWKRRAAI